MVRGGTITDEIYQINAILLKAPEKEEKTPEPAVEAPPPKKLGTRKPPSTPEGR